MDIGSRLDEAMRDAKIESQSHLARLSGVPQATISRILKGSGKQGPETVTLVALGRALNVEVRWLQTGSGPKRQGREEHLELGEKVDQSYPLKLVDQPAPPELQWITPREAELLSEFRACAEPQKKTLLTAARGLPKSLARPVPAVAGDKAK
jgi:transcriptional regulator with XRE-family HTH domain